MYKLMKEAGRLSGKRIISVGVPQGSILGCLLLLLFVNDLPLDDKVANFTTVAEEITIAVLDVSQQKL